MIQIPLKHFSTFIVVLRNTEYPSVICQEKSLLVPNHSTLQQTSGWSIPSPHLTMPQTELIRKLSLLWAWNPSEAQCDGKHQTRRWRGIVDLHNQLSPGKNLCSGVQSRPKYVRTQSVVFLLRASEEDDPHFLRRECKLY